MAWIESHDTLGYHTKTNRLIRALNISRVEAVGHLQFLWWWALREAETGDLTPFQAEDIADAALWEGDALAFVNALRAAGFITAENCLHDWYDYAGKLIEQRRTNAARQAAFRNGHKPPPPLPPNGPALVRNDDVTPTDAARNGYVPVTAPSGNVLTVPTTVPTTKTVETIPPTPQAEPPPGDPPAAGAAEKPARTKSARASPVTGWNYPLLWQLITEQQGFAPDWNYAAQTEAVNRILAKHPGEQPGDLARFLAYKGACYRADPSGQPTFTAYGADYPGWVRAGKPAQPPKGSTNGRLSASENEQRKLRDIAAYVAS